MDSPEPAKSISTGAATLISASATPSSDSPVQESPFSNFLSNLSPINSVKAAHAPQGFLGLSSPPLVFTSPRNILHQRTSFLQRSQLSHISSLELPEKDDGCKKLDDLSDDLKDPKTYCKTLIDDTLEENDIRNNMEDQPGSLSGCADEYLNDPGDVDCINSASPVDQNVKQSNDVLQSSISSLSNANSDEKCQTRAEVSSSTLSEQTKEDPPGRSFNEINPGYIEEEQTGSKHPLNESDLSIDRDPEINLCNALGNQASEEYAENVKTTSMGSIQNVAQCDLEVSQLQRGLSRRCLQFEEAGRKSDVRSNPPSNQTEMESLGSTHIDLTAPSNKNQMLNLSQLAISASRSTGKSHIVVPKPSGIGLHLNSVALPMGSHISVSIIKSKPTKDSHQLDNKGYSEKLSKLIEKVAIAPEDGMSEPLSFNAATSESCQTLKPLNTTHPIDHVTPLNKRNFNLELADNFEELTQLSPTKKKRKTSSSPDGDGCKRCNCKKSKCLKLYCDCFAAGIYCSESCACQGCFNKPEYESTVLETRQLIESRNPLAFAPKVVQHVSERVAVNKDDGSRKVPSLARHKRGCNCKKSMCLKKYCECYQANVGCSSECRCEGCRNSYGRKEYHSREEIIQNRVCKEILGGSYDHNSGMVGTDKGFLQAELQDPPSLTPSTPSFQHSDHGKDAAKSRANSSKYVPSLDSDFSNLPSYSRSIRSLRSSPSNDMTLQGSEEILDIDSFGEEMDYNINVSDIMDQFSPKCNALASICDLTPSQNSSITTLASSDSSNTKRCVSGSKFQLCPSRGQFSSGRSLRWRSSPINPMPQLGDTKTQDNDSDSGLYDLLGDETPEILKESPAPITSIKATSPNKKRVSPPHVHGLRPSSGVGLRSGRKFILTAISSTPSLTPCAQSKGKADDKSSNK